MANQYSNNTLKNQVKKCSQQSLPLLSKISQGPPLLPKIPQQSLPLPSNISQQNLSLPSKVPSLLPKASENSPLPSNFSQKNSLLHFKIPQQPPQEVYYNYVKVPQDHYSFLHSETSEMNQLYSIDPCFNSNLTQFLMPDKEKKQSLSTKV